MSDRTELEELGEFGLIEEIKKKVKIKNDSTHVGIGDDSAIIEPVDSHVLWSTDMLVEGVHFDLTFCPLKHVGYKSAVVNFSDIYAMNAYPTQATLSVAVSNRYSKEAIDEFLDGFLLACEKYNVDLVGGDTTSSLSGMVISVGVMGYQSKEKTALRSTAKESDLLCVSGDLGAAYIGLQVLNREKAVFKQNPNIQPELEGFDYILERQLKPEARKDVIQKLDELGVVPTSMIDISDGLASEVIHLSRSSELGCQIYEEKIPVDYQTNQVAEDFRMSGVSAALNGGEDYELLFTISQDDYEKLKDVQGISIIGHMTGKGENYYLVTKDGGAVALTSQGWDSLLQKERSNL